MWRRRSRCWLQTYIQPAILSRFVIVVSEILSHSFLPLPHSPLLSLPPPPLPPLSLSLSLFSLYFFQSSVDIVRAFQFHQGLITGKNLKWPVADVSLGFFQAAMIRFNLGTYFPCRDSRVASEQMLAEQIQISVICHSLLLFSISLSISFSFFLSFFLSFSCWLFKHGWLGSGTQSYRCVLL